MHFLKKTSGGSGGLISVTIRTATPIMNAVVSRGGGGGGGGGICNGGVGEDCATMMGSTFNLEGVLEEMATATESVRCYDVWVVAAVFAYVAAVIAIVAIFLYVGWLGDPAKRLVSMRPRLEPRQCGATADANTKTL
jgi:hypothetical protein